MIKIQQLYNPSNAFGNPVLLTAIQEEREELERKRLIAECDKCDLMGMREDECYECNGRGSIELTCDH